MTYEDICAQLAAGCSLIQINGDIACTEPLIITQDNVKIVGPGRLIGGDYCLVIRGKNVRIDEVDIEAIQPVFIQNTIRVRLSGMTIRFYGEYGVRAHNGGGLWLRDCHIDGGTIGQTAISIGEWDTAFLRDTLIEQPHTGVRLGDNGGVGNVWMSGVVSDRNRAVAFHLDPPPDKTIQNVQMTNIWGEHGEYAIVMDGRSGPIRNVQISNARFNGFANKQIAKSGDVTKVQESNVLHL